MDRQQVDNTSGNNSNDENGESSMLTTRPTAHPRKNIAHK